MPPLSRAAFRTSLSTRWRSRKRTSRRRSEESNRSIPSPDAPEKTSATPILARTKEPALTCGALIVAPATDRSWDLRVNTVSHRYSLSQFVSTAFSKGIFKAKFENCSRLNTNLIYIFLDWKTISFVFDEVLSNEVDCYEGVYRVLLFHVLEVLLHFTSFPLFHSTLCHASKSP